MPSKLEELIVKHKVPKAHRKILTFSGTSFAEALNSHAPFVQFQGKFRSTVTLLSRFLYNFKNVCLYNNRRFQIRSGFIFEVRIKDELKQQGFIVQPIKRLHRKEFDVIVTRDETIFNIQCKNNLVDPSWVQLDPARFIRTNRTLERYYERALAKERSRDQLLKDHLKLQKVESLIVTRFPIVSTNPRIIPFTRIQDFELIVETLSQADCPKPLPPHAKPRQP